jgi:hypothetical protein
MASGHVNRTQRPNTWLHRPSLQREDSPCQLGAVHTWHKADAGDGAERCLLLGFEADIGGATAPDRAVPIAMAPIDHSRSAALSMIMTPVLRGAMPVDRELPNRANRAALDTRWLVVRRRQGAAKVLR